MAKHFHKMYGNKGWVFDYPVSAIWNNFCSIRIPVNTWCYIPTSLPPEPSSMFYSLIWIHALDTKGLFQLHGGMVSRMQVLATPSSIVHNTKYLDPYHWKHISSSCFFLRQWCRDVASGMDRHPDRIEIYFRLQMQGNKKTHPLFPYIS